MARFDENTRVKFPATVQFIRLGYEYQSLKDAEIDFDTKIFKDRFKSSLERINNCVLTDKDVEKTLSEINSLIQRKDMGQEFYLRLIMPNGKLKLIDFDDYSNNDFAVTCELPFAPEEDTESGSFRPDVIPLINGMPLGFLEVKIPNNQGGIQKEFHRMLDERLQNPKFDKYFNMIQFVTFSNNMDYESSDDTVEPEQIRQGSFYSTPNGNHTYFNFFREKSETRKTDGFIDVTADEIRNILKDNGYNEAEYDTPEFQTNLELDTPCNQFITSFFEPERTIYLLNYGFCYVQCKDEKTGNPYTEKHIMRYPQFFASRAILDRLEGTDKSGIIWHTQGSGKTELAAYSNRIIRDYYAKKGISTRFFFIVDRLDLLMQAKDEFEHRGLTTSSVSNKKDFVKELNRTIDGVSHGKDLGNFTVVNVQKIIDNMPEAKNAYDVQVQRVFFIDEAHRSYKQHGEYYKNLKSCDRDGIFIGLTGTPILTKAERSNLKFGDYIHKYFYNDSIADGYTLRIKRENIQTVKREELRHNLELEDPDPDADAVLKSEAYKNDLCKYIEEDFINFRLVNGDKSIGGMIVCSSNPQAKAIGEWFEKNSKLRTGVVITDTSEKMQAQRNKELQRSFKYDGTPDILIVHQMLTTGYDVRRLKKMYLLRNAHAQSLLQTISRVNRPYKAPNGKVYNYGYIMDFVDISEEFERTIGAYIDELERDANIDEEGGLTGVVVGPDDIYKKYQQYFIQVQLKVDTSGNLELFSRSLNDLSMDELYTLRKSLQICHDCYMELHLSGSTYVKDIDDELLKKWLKLTQDRIHLRNLRDGSPIDTLAILNNGEIVQIVYEFIKTSSKIMNLGALADPDRDPNLKAISKTIEKIQREISRNRNRNQSELIRLDKLLAKIFAKLDIQDAGDFVVFDDELGKVLVELHRLNEENARLSEKYDGQYAFVKTFTDVCEQHPEFDKADVEEVVYTVFESVKENTDRNHLLMQGRQNFVAYNSKIAVTKFVKNGLYKKMAMNTGWFKDMLNDLYTNLQLV